MSTILTAQNILDAILAAELERHDVDKAYMDPELNPEDEIFIDGTLNLGLVAERINDEIARRSATKPFTGLEAVPGGLDLPPAVATVENLDAALDKSVEEFRQALARLKTLPEHARESSVARMAKKLEALNQ